MKTSFFRREHVVAMFAILGGISVLGGLEVIEEPDMTMGEVMLELIEPTILVLTAAAVVYVLLKTNRQHVTQMTLIRSLENGRVKGQEFRVEVRDMVKGLGQAIDTQFIQWGLTDAEREIGLLLLKGLSHKEIAVMRQSSERTVRRQASSIYSKANLTGRASLSSYFLEDLLPPQD